VASVGDAEDVVKVILETASGVVGEIDINQASPTTPYFLDVWGSRGVITLPPNDLQHFTVKSFPASAVKATALEPGLASADRRYPEGTVPFQDSMIPVDERLAVDVYADLARAIRTGARPFVKPEEPLALMRLIDRCRAAAGTTLRTPLLSATQGVPRTPPKSVMKTAAKKAPKGDRKATAGKKPKPGAKKAPKKRPRKG